MPEERVSRWHEVVTFLRKGPRYLRAYGGWRARRAICRLTERRRSWPEASEVRSKHEKLRSGGLLLCDWSRRSGILERLPGSVREETVAAAYSLARRRFVYRGQEVVFDGPIDWGHSPDGNRDWMWDLNRHHFLVTLGRAYWYTGDEEHARVLRQLLREWMEANPPGVEARQWRSVFEVGIRATNWCWAHSLLGPSSTLDEDTRVDMLRGILGMGRFLDTHIELHAWNNHLLLEAKSLALLGILYPELPGAPRWARRGLQLLEQQIRRQVLDDGVHSELSSMYHEIVASELLELAVALRLTGDADLLRQGAEMLERVSSMAEFLRAITRRDGSTPLLGDSSAAPLHVRYEVSASIDAIRTGALLPSESTEGCSTEGYWRNRLREGTIWLLAAANKLPPSDGGRRSCGASSSPGRGTAGAVPSTSPADGARATPTCQERSSRGFPDGGYWILRSDEGEAALHMLFDCGPFGDPIVPGHGHADALSIDLTVGKGHLLIDPGNFGTHQGKRWRNYFRGTQAHNTVVVDGRDQTILKGIRHAYHPAKTRLLGWSTCPAFDIVAGEHDGYTRLSGRPVHQRCVFFNKPRYWVLLDRILGEGAHTCDLLFHLHPAHEPAVDKDTLRAIVRDPSGSGLLVVPLDRGGLELDVPKGTGEERPVGGPIQGWVSSSSGVREPAPVVRHRKKETLPLGFATILVPLTGEAAQPPETERLLVFGPAGTCAEGYVGARIHVPGMWTDTVLLGMPPRSAPGTLRRVGDLHTDALAASVTTGNDGCTGGAVCQGSRLLWGDKEVAWLEPEDTAGDFAFRTNSGVLSVWTAGDLRRRPGVRLLLRAGYPQKVLLDGSEIPWEHEVGATVIRMPD